MKNILIRFSLIILVFGLLTFIPRNVNLTFGYNDTPVCGKEKPSKVVLYEPNHQLLPKATGVGEVRLNWLKAFRANKYTIGFGTTSGNYIYGATNLPDIDNYTVSNLNPGTRYYFAVRGVNDCMPGEWSREWSAVVGRGSGNLTYTGSENNNKVLPSTNLRKQGTGNENVVPSVAPKAEDQNLPPVGQPTPRVGFFQRILNFFLGR